MPDHRAPAQPIDVDQIVTADLGRSISIGDPGRLGQQVIDALTRLVPPDLIARKVYELIEATHMTKAGPEPDVRAMEAGLKLALAYQVGRPIERVLTVTKNADADPDADLAARLRKSPALRRLMRDALAECEG